MLDQLKAVFTASAWWSYVACIGGFYILAWVDPVESPRVIAEGPWSAESDR